jgi:hypothetical protein
MKVMQNLPGCWAVPSVQGVAGQPLGRVGVPPNHIGRAVIFPRGARSELCAADDPLEHAQAVHAACDDRGEGEERAER